MTELNGAMMRRRTPKEVNVFFANLPAPLSPQDMADTFERRYGFRLMNTPDEYARVSEHQIRGLGEEVQRMIQDFVRFVEGEYHVKLPDDVVRVEILIGRDSKDPEILKVTADEVTLKPSRP